MTDARWWEFKRLWLEREAIAAKRFNAGLPMPLWAVKFRINVWRHRRSERRQVRVFERQYPNRRW